MPPPEQQQQYQTAQYYAEQLYRAAATKDLTSLKHLLHTQRINPNLYYHVYGATALHTATFNRHAEAVRLLLNYGANPLLRNRHGQSTFEINDTMEDETIFDLLHPKIAKEKRTKHRAAQRKIAEYEANHLAPPDTLDIILRTADEYRNTEQTPSITSKNTALSYIQSAIYYIELEALKAEQYLKGSEKRYPHESKITRLFHCIAASADYLTLNHEAVIQNTPGIDWLAIAQFARHYQYSPFFISHLNYTDKARLFEHALQESALSGELSHLKTACRNLQANPNFKQNAPIARNYSRLIGWFNDEYAGQYLQEAVHNFRTKPGHFDSHSRARILRSIMIIGEALYVASPVLRHQFTPEAVNLFIHARNILCHPERPENAANIKECLKRKQRLNINGTKVGLSTFVGHMTIMAPIVKQHLERYNFTPPTTDAIRNYGPDDVWDHPKPQTFDPKPPKRKKPADQTLEELEKNEQELLTIPPTLRTNAHLDKLKEIQQTIIRRKEKSSLEALEQEFRKWVDKHDPHKDQRKLNKKLRSPETAVQEIKNTLAKYKSTYETATTKQQQSQPLSKEEKDTLKGYPNLQKKEGPWAQYAQQKQQVETKAQKQTDTLNQQHEETRRQKTANLIRSALEYVSMLSPIFTNLSNPRWVHATAGSYLSRGFGSHPDHHVLEFYQIMIGSIARGLLSEEKFKQHAPTELALTLENVTQASRGYLAHIGIREHGKTSEQTPSRAQVFFSNSKAILAAAPALQTTAYALEHNITYTQAAQLPQAIVAPPLPKGIAV